MGPPALDLFCHIGAHQPWALVIVWAERWAAYEELAAKASRERQSQSGADDWQTALGVFENLGFAAHVPAHVKEGATAIVDHGKCAADVQHVTDVLMRFHCNQFGFRNGVPADQPAFCASAVYGFISRVNHSCAPTMWMASKERHCEVHKRRFDPAADGGVLVACATRDLMPGEPLTFSYLGQSMGEDWPVAKRRAALLAGMGFVCACERCVAEERCAAEEREQQAAREAAAELT